MKTNNFTFCECLECDCYNYVSVDEEDGFDIYVCEDCLIDHVE